MHYVRTMAIAEPPASPPPPGRRRFGRITLDIRQHLSPWKQAAFLAGSLAVGLAVSVAILAVAGIAPATLAEELAAVFGADSLRAVLVRAAQCLGARERSIFREVYFPASLPHIFTGLTVGMGVAWVSLIAAEMISGQYGIGYFTWEAYSLVQYPDIALGMIAIGVIGLGSSVLIRGAGHLVMPWRSTR